MDNFGNGFPPHILKGKTKKEKDEETIQRRKSVCTTISCIGGRITVRRIKTLRK